jgi:hypothetical protein
LVEWHIFQPSTASHENPFEAMGNQAVEKDAGSLEITPLREGYNDVHWH